MMMDLANPWHVALLFGIVALVGVKLLVTLRRYAGIRATNAELSTRLKALDDDMSMMIRTHERYCEQLMRSAHAGFFDWNLQSAKVRYGGTWVTALDGKPLPLRDSLSRSTDPWLQLCHPHDRRKVQRLLRGLVAGEQEWVSCEMRLRSARGRWHWVLINAQVVERDAVGHPLRVFGTQVDINRTKHTEHLLHAEKNLFSSGPVIVLCFDAAPPYRLRRASPSFQAARGLPDHTSAIGRPLATLLHPDDDDALAESARRVLNQRKTQVQCEIRLATTDGRWPWYLLHVVADRSNCEAPQLHAYLVDINLLKEAESDAVIHNATQQEMVSKMAETQRFMAALQQITELLQLCDNDGESRQVIEQGGTQLFPCWSGALTFADEDGLMSVAASWGEPFTPPHSDEADCWAVRRGRLHQHHVGSSATALSPVCGHFGGGQALPAGIAHAICAPLLKSFDRPGALHLIARETLNEENLLAAAWGAEALANALKLSLGNLRLRNSLREEAVHDVMTELYNRRYFDEALSRELSRSQRTGDGLILAIMDIDHFKTFNDSFGHEAGDKVLKTVAEQLRDFVRTYDIACRVGGEELAIIMPRVNIDEACARLNQLREEISACALTDHGTSLPAITVSIGVADLASGAPEDLMRRADAALYAAKHGGRNQVNRWEPSRMAASFGAFGRGKTAASTVTDPRMHS